MARAQAVRSLLGQLRQLCSKELAAGSGVGSLNLLGTSAASCSASVVHSSLLLSLMACARGSPGASAAARGLPRGRLSSNAAWPHQAVQLRLPMPGGASPVVCPWWSRHAGHLRGKSTIAATPAGTTATGAGAVAASLQLTGSEALSAGVSPALRRQLQWWMAGTAAWVYTLVVLGGITRLTRSGLSMTDWKFTGERPPLTEDDWRAEFAKYQQSPEFKLIHSRMTLSEFKFIFWMEYGHRMWGRMLGLTFVMPLAYFAACGAINGALAKRLGLLFFMGGTQGLVGWWMVRSGFEEPKHEWQQVRVSPYRLVGHLVSAFAIFATLTWTALDLGTPVPLARHVSPASQRVTARVKAAMLPFAALVAITAASGAFVAGIDAGRAYNEFPLMGGQLVPEEYWLLWDKGFGVRNFFENTATVQFDHRLLATTTACLALALWAWVRAQPLGALPRRAVLATDLVAAVTLAQWGLGIWTLLEYVPTHLGSAHQANALNLFVMVLVTLHALRPATAGPAAQVAARWATPAAMTMVAAVAWGVTTQK